MVIEPHFGAAHQNGCAATGQAMEAAIPFLTDGARFLCRFGPVLIVISPPQLLELRLCQNGWHIEKAGAAEEVACE